MRKSSIGTAVRAVALGCALAGCSDTDSADDSAVQADAGPPEVTLRSDVQAIRRAKDALPGVFIPPFVDCREPLEGDEPGQGTNGEVCTNVAISGCTEPGKYFPDYAECDVVRTQRPFWPAPPASQPREDDPRLDDDNDFLHQLAWMTEQVGASGCACCHDSRAVGGMAAQWDIALGPIWLDTLSDTGLALFVGFADSSVLGAYQEQYNFGFDRTRTGIPTTDTKRMKDFLLLELARRGISEQEAREVPPFGGPIYANAVAKPKPCRAGEGITPKGDVRWRGGDARYVYVAEDGSKNPGVPPNLDSPEGTLWRLDVLASAEPIKSGLRYGTTPKGSFQALPVEDSAPQLKRGDEYVLTALRDVGLPLVSCVFTFGDEVRDEEDEPAVPDVGSGSGTRTDAGAECTEDFFGRACTDPSAHSGCGCAADYCAVMPGQSEGYCTATGCKDDPSVCPDGWSCFDVSQFQPGQPAICLQP